MFKVVQSPNSELVSVVRTERGSLVGYAMTYANKIIFSGMGGSTQSVEAVASRVKGREVETIRAIADFAMEPEALAALDAKAAAKAESEVL